MRWKVALFPYDNKTLVVENFNDEAVNLRVVINSKVSALRNLLTDDQLNPRPQLHRIRLLNDGGTSVKKTDIC